MVRLKNVSRLCALGNSNAAPQTRDPCPAIAVGSSMNKRLTAALVAVGSALLLAGCATVSREGRVAVSLVSVRPVQSSLFETTAELTLRITNETVRPLSLAGSTHRLYLNGTYVGRAVTNEKLRIPHLGTSTQVLNAHLENLVLMRKAQELGNVAAVDYRIDSRLLAAEEEGGGVITTTSTGQLDLSGLLPAQSVQPRAQ
jgi:LEA14-like dessication related protein